MISTSPVLTAADDLGALSARLVALEAHSVAREERLALVEEENRWLKAQLFGRSSEKLPNTDINPDQRRLFNEIEALAEPAKVEHEKITVPAHERRRRGRKPLSAALPRVEVIHDLSEAEKICPVDGTALERIGQETSEQLEMIPAQIRVIRHIRPKYACPCCRVGVKIAPVPAMLFPKSIATPSLLAQVATAKFVDGTPLYRQEPQFARLGVQLGRATMAGWMIRIGGEYLVPLINLLSEMLLAEPVVHCDETHLQVLKSEKAPTADHWMWVRAAGPPGQRIVLFDYDASRSGAVPRRLLAGYQGVLVTDGYAAYDGAAQVLGLTHAGCMAHARRKFDEALKAQPMQTSHAKCALDFIAELALIERPLWDAAQPCSATRRLEVRQRRAAPIMARFHAWLEALAPQVLPESRLGKAVHYTLAQWPKLSVFLSHGDVPMHNNRCENAIRPFVIGRKGWLFADTVKGAVASANLYSLIETCKANGVEPHAYLSRLFERIPHLTSVADYEALLPWNALAPARH